MTTIADVRAKHAEVIGTLLYAEKSVTLADKAALAKAWERDLFAERALPGREEHTQSWERKDINRMLVEVIAAANVCHVLLRLSREIGAIRAAGGFGG